MVIFYSYVNVYQRVVGRDEASLKIQSDLVEQLRHQQWRVAPEKHGLVPSLLGALVAIRHSAGTRQGGKRVVISDLVC